MTSNQYIRIETTADAREWRVLLIAPGNPNEPLITTSAADALRYVLELRKYPNTQISNFTEREYITLLESAFAEIDRKYTAQIDALLSD